MESVELIVIGVAAIGAILSGMFVAFRAAKPKRPPVAPRPPEPIVKVLRDLEHQEDVARTERRLDAHDEVMRGAAKPQPERSQANVDWLNAPNGKK